MGNTLSAGETMAQASPILLLHQWTESKKLPYPVYSFEEIEGPKFRCTVQVAGETAVGISTTKRQAKKESAQNALEKLQSEKPSVNYVGELNVYSSKHHVDYPIYECLPTTMKTGDFIVNCSFLGCEALGKGKNRKEAKQNAARNMIELYLSEGKCRVETEKEAKEGEKPTVKEVEGKNTEVVKTKNVEKKRKSKENSGEGHGESCLIETPKKTKAGKKKTAKEKSDVNQAEKNSKTFKIKEDIGESIQRKEIPVGQVDGLCVQDFEKIVATVNTLDLNQEGKSGSKPTQIQIVINLQK